MKNFTLLFAALFALLLTSCQKEALHELPTANNNDLTTQTNSLVVNVSPKENISVFLQNDANFSLFFEALEHTNLASFLLINDITVFAPNNSAMKKLMDKGQYETIQEFPPMNLKKFMLTHISLTGQHTLDSDTRGKDVQTLQEDKTVYMQTTDGTVHSGTSVSHIYIANQQQTNGIVHQVSSVFMPY